MNSKEKAKKDLDDKKLTDQFVDLQKTIDKTGIIKLDFHDRGLDAASFKAVVKACLELFQKNKTAKLELLDLSGKNSLTDNCQKDLINLINNLPDSNFMDGKIDVYMSRDPFEELEIAVEAKQKKNGDEFVIIINNKKTNLRI